MARYLVLWRVNPAAWPTDPKQSLAVWQMAAGGGDALLKSGALKELSWLSSEMGLAIFEADSKAAVMGMVQPFFPMFTQEIHEIVPWEAGKQALLNSASQVASR